MRKVGKFVVPNKQHSILGPSPPWGTFPIQHSLRPHTRNMVKTLHTEPYHNKHPLSRCWTSLYNGLSHDAAFRATCLPPPLSSLPLAHDSSTAHQPPSLTPASRRQPRGLRARPRGRAAPPTARASAPPRGRPPLARPPRAGAARPPRDRATQRARAASRRPPPRAAAEEAAASRRRRSAGASFPASFPLLRWAREGSPLPATRPPRGEAR
jgi:hypothetical protein